MKWLVCGGRDFGDFSSKLKGTWEYDTALTEAYWGKGVLDRLAEAYSAFYNPGDNWLPTDIEVIHGAARGADKIGDEWAVVNWCPIHEYPADWNKYGKRAGYLRNVQMLEEGRPDLVICFPGGRGTEMMFNLARKAGVHVIRYLDMLTKEEHNENQ